MNSLNASSVSVQDAQSDLISRVTHYHKQTKHHFNRYARSLGYLDWANQPDLFRGFEGAPLIPLPRIMFHGENEGYSNGARLMDAVSSGSHASVCYWSYTLKDHGIPYSNHAGMQHVGVERQLTVEATGDVPQDVGISFRRVRVHGGHRAPATA